MEKRLGRRDGRPALVDESLGKSDGPALVEKSLGRSVESAQVKESLGEMKMN